MSSKPALKRIWNGLPLQEATENLRIQILPEDIDGAATKDEGHCVLAKACRRQFNAHHVAFSRTRAIVEIYDDAGNAIAERYLLDPPARQIIADFDRGLPLDIKGQMIVLTAPSPSKTLEGERLKSKRNSSKKKRKSTGSHTRRFGPNVIAELDVRSGTGKMHKTLLEGDN